MDKCPTLVREVGRMTIKIMLEHREPLTDRPEKS